MEFLDIAITNRKPYSTPFLKTYGKNPRNKNSRAYLWKACCITENKGRKLKSKKTQIYAQKPWHKKNADQEFISAYEYGSSIIISQIQGVRAYGDSSNEHLLVKIEGENRQQHFVWNGAFVKRFVQKKRFVMKIFLAYS
jgi:hypothetical protein